MSALPQIQIWLKTDLQQPQVLLRLNDFICPGEVTVPFISPLRGQKSSNALRAIDVGETSSRSFVENSAKDHLATPPGNIPKLWLRPREAQSPPTGDHGHSHRSRALSEQLLVGGGGDTERATASANRTYLDKVDCQQSTPKTPSEK